MPLPLFHDLPFNDNVSHLPHSDDLPLSLSEFSHPFGSLTARGHNTPPMHELSLSPIMPHVVRPHNGLSCTLVTFMPEWHQHYSMLQLSTPWRVPLLFFPSNVLLLDLELLTEHQTASSLLVTCPLIVLLDTPAFPLLLFTFLYYLECHHVIPQALLMDLFPSLTFLDLPWWCGLLIIWPLLWLSSSQTLPGYHSF